MLKRFTDKYITTINLNLHLMSYFGVRHFLCNQNRHDGPRIAVYAVRDTLNETGYVAMGVVGNKLPKIVVGGHFWKLE
jgi:hypothetical protein